MQPPFFREGRDRSVGRYERRGSRERRSPRGLPERRSPRARSFERPFFGGPATGPSGQWQQSLGDGKSASVYFISDESNLQQAAQRLNYLGQGAIIVMDFHGFKLRTAAGELCLLTIAFTDRDLEVFIFDVLQLGEQIVSLTPFFTNPNASKITTDATTHATVLAHKFGVNLTGVIDAQWAYETLEKRSMVSPIEIFEWCGLGTVDFKKEARRIEESPEIWAQRPLPQPILSHAATSICLLHSAASVMWQRLAKAFGQTVFNMVANASKQKAETGAAAGWACRNWGLWTPEPNKENELEDRFRYL